MSRLTLDLVNFILPSQKHPYDRDPAHPFWFRRDKNTAQYANLVEWHGKEWADRLFQATGLPNDQRDKGWKGVRPLGAGGFGWAALYELREDGQVVDRIAIKEAEIADKSHMKHSPPGLRLPDEATIMQQTNLCQNPNIVKLRAFKRYKRPRTARDRKKKGTKKNKQKWPERDRFYLEYCPHGDMATLLKRYRHFARFFPESFIWHVFHGLANAVFDLRYGRYTFPKRKEKSPSSADCEIVHFDLKPENVFLADPQDIRGSDDWQDAKHSFPIVKLADFGIADITHAGDKDNPEEQWWRGTRELLPPEQDDMWDYAPPPSIFLFQWFPDNQRKPWKENGGPGKFNEKHNIFAIAQIVWSMMHLDRFKTRSVYRLANNLTADRHFIDRIDTRRGKVKKPGKRVKNHQASEEDTDYSDRLRRLVRDCLHPDPRERPTALTLITQIRDGFLWEMGKREHYREVDNKYYNKSPDPHKVYFQGNEMSQMEPEGLFYPPWKYDDPHAPENLTRPGWVTVAHDHLRPPNINEPLQTMRGLPKAPIIFPKLRWYPREKRYHLMQKKEQNLFGQKRRVTRWARTHCKPGYSDVYEDTPNGPRKIKYPDYLSEHREKDVWVGLYDEHGSFEDEEHEAYEAEMLQLANPPITCDSCLSARHHTVDCPIPADYMEACRRERVDYYEMDVKLSDERICLQVLPMEPENLVAEAVRQLFDQDPQHPDALKYQADQAERDAQAAAKAAAAEEDEEEEGEEEEEEGEEEEGEISEEEEKEEDHEDEEEDDDDDDGSSEMDEA